MPEFNLKAPSYPEELQKALLSATKERHPFLAQGMLYHYWEPGQGRQAPRNRSKEQEAAKQAQNCSQFFIHFKQGSKNNPPIFQTLPQQPTRLAAGRHMITGDLEAKSSLLVGVGLPNPLENGMAIHPLYGVPYLPGSSIKGIAQHYVLLRWAAEAGIPRLKTEQIFPEEDNKRNKTPLWRFEVALMAAGDPGNLPETETKEESWADRCKEVGDELRVAQVPTDRWDDWRERPESRIKGQLYIRLFGTQRHQGRVIYFDAFPTSLTMGADVVTPHHTLYYTAGDNPPSLGDWSDPVPSQFLIVAVGSAFQITVMAKTGSRDDRDVTDAAFELIKHALSEHGIGAKTGFGYGRLG